MINLKFLIDIVSAIVSIISAFSVSQHINLLILLILIFAILFSFKKSVKNRIILNIVGIFFIIFTILRINIQNITIPIAECLIILISIKFLEEKKFRDYMQIFILSIFLLAISTLLSLSIKFMIPLTIMLLLLCLACILLSYYNEQNDINLTYKNLYSILLASLNIFILSIPLALTIFFIIPRTNYPLFDFLQRNEKGAISGFSEKISLGDTENIEESNAVTFRAKMNKIDNNFLYWRGAIVDLFDGKTWKLKDKVETEEKHYLNGESINQEIFIDMFNSRYLFAIDKPMRIDIKGINITKDLTISMKEEVSKKIRYKTVSILTNKIYDPSINQIDYLNIPNSLSEKIIRLAKNLKKSNNSETAENILIFLKKNFQYTLLSLPVENISPLEEFLFKSKMGNCEYFATAMAIMLRINAIPSRVVLGYKGGEYNNIAGYYIVRQKDAHAWVEAYIDKNWIRFDPTPYAVIPKDILYKNFSFDKIKIALDTINYYWFTLIVNYNIDKQVHFALNLHYSLFKLKSKINIKDIVIFIAIISLFITTVILTLKYFKNITRFNIKNDFKNKIAEKFFAKMSKLGYERKSCETFEEFIEKIGNIRLKRKASIFLKILSKLYYKDIKVDVKSKKLLIKIIKQISNSI